ncbi:hypothetical protein TanjilG_32669 [Lupinus angustifolius]|uniref:Alpha/beta hydrolase fold-3 domain-containing protein n=1 Tax=Lupinus angustifolius TaxID=3871 RepID=A0A394DDY7_LUPAN|nr:PREDICTED: carboxylesterase 1-like [Lupinus angustifolius]OIW21355.1 hypothetical protein TanjilG_32669 [Lupinus angustifolius]
MSNKASSQSQPFDPYEYLQIVQSPDGTLTCSIEYPKAPPTSDPNLLIPVLTKDVTINESTKTWVRLFLPRRTLLSSHGSNSNHKLPIIVFFHSGGFICASAATIVVHDFCVDMADNVEAIVVSVDYRLAPKHRLPAQYDDAMDALYWIRSSQDEWLTKYADISNCYLMGNSAGANISYHTGLRVAEDVDHFKPLKIQGFIFRQPFFGGIKRTDSELRLENDPVIPVSTTDLMWELALPIGANREHEYCNLRVGNGPKKLDEFRKLGWRALVSWTGGDQLGDRGKELVQLLDEKGVQVVSDFHEEGCHEVEYNEPLKAKQLLGLVKGFISS